MKGEGKKMAAKKPTPEVEWPHDEVYVMLKPSLAAPGKVGLFAITNISAGTLICKTHEEPMVWIPGEVIENLSPAERELCDDLGVWKDGCFGLPAHGPNNATTAWYTRHSDSPNAAMDGNYDLVANQDIPAGTEVTIDYGTFNDPE
jgi:hypothetical protein